MIKLLLRLLLVVLLMVPGLQATADAPTDAGSFTNHVLDVASNNFPDKVFSLGKQPMQITCGSVSINLENLYRTLSSRGFTNADPYIAKFLSNALSLAASQIQAQPAAWESVKSRLRPQLIPVEYLKLGKSFIYESCPFSKDLLLGYVIDSPESVSFVRPEDVNSWAVDVGTLSRIAFNNLEAASQFLPDRVQDHGPGGKGKWLAISVMDGYDATRILLPDLRKRIEDRLGSPFYAAIPNRDFLICWSRNYWKFDEFAAEVKQDYQTKNYQMSPDVYLIKNQEIKPFHR